MNESDTDMERMELLAGGYHEDIELERRTTELKLLAAKKAAMIDKHTFGDLDFTHWYRLDIWYGVDTPCEAWFQIGRVHALNQSNEHYCDYFEKIGHKIEIGRRSSFGRSSH